MNSVQKQRYSRHVMLANVGEDGQCKLLNAKVLVVGAGGLGAPVLQYLVAAGVGCIGIVDDDVVSISNLQRQVLYKENQLGQLKVEKAKEALLCLNSEVNIVTYAIAIDDGNAEKIVANYDVVVGATDNFASRLAINAATKKHRIPFVHGSIGEFEGQISVFNYNDGPSYTDLFSDTSDKNELPSGVLGVLPGIIGSMQAAEVIKIILGVGDVLSGKLLVYNALEADCKLLRFT